jgi:tetratricopeptide (TPR) repeat protein
MYIVAMSHRKPSQEKIDHILNLFKSNKIQQALDFIDSLSKDYPDNSLLFNIRGACYAGLGQLEIAVKNYERALSIRPEYAKAHYNLGSVLQELGKLHDSVKSYENSIAFEPENAQAHNNLAIVLRELGQLEEAEVNCRKAIVLDPEYAEGYCSLSVILYANGDLNSALESIQIAYSINPKSKLIKLLFAVLKARKNRNTNDVSDGNISKSNFVTKLTSNPLILNRAVEQELIAKLYEMKSLEHYPQTDTIYGNARGSGYQLFQDDYSSIIRTVRDDLVRILTKAINTDIYIKDSFFHIMGAGGAGVNRHNHIGDLDLDSSLNLIKQKFSLVYYLSIGDQDCSEPGTLRLYDPSENILPSEGKIVIFPADRYHSVTYNGGKDRIMISINFYSL